MFFKPHKELDQAQVEAGLKTIVAEGLAAEAMIAMTGGTFLVAIAIHLGATDFQIGLLAAIPMLANLFQLSAIWILKKYNSRKLLGIIGNILGRVPLLIIGIIPLFFSASITVNFLLFLMVFHYFFGSIANA